METLLQLFENSFRSTSESIVLWHFAACAFMTGVIWFVQLVHYPGFLFADRAQMTPFSHFYAGRTTWVVLPPMCLELLAAASLCVLFQNALWGWNLAGVLLIWAITFLKMVPLHSKLASGWDPQTIHSLVHWNWPRTFLWSARTVGLIAFA